MGFKHDERDAADAAVEIYERRFSAVGSQAKRQLWREISKYLQRFVDLDGRTIDIGCDRGDFIATIKSVERWASDIRDVSAQLPPDVRFVRSDGRDLLNTVPASYFDTVFMSNYLEHLPSSEAVVEQLAVAFKLCRPGGSVIVLQPNVRLIGGRYWDFIDHRVPLTERSLIEAAEIVGFSTRRVITRFLPYTTCGRLPVHRRLVRMYLRMPVAWRILGKQTLYIGQRP